MLKCDFNENVLSKFINEYLHEIKYLPIWIGEPFSYLCKYYVCLLLFFHIHLNSTTKNTFRFVTTYNPMIEMDSQQCENY